jgi:hypothetical protein
MDENFLKYIILGEDELSSNLHNGNPLPHHNPPSHKKACQVLSKINVMLTVFLFNYKGAVHLEYAPAHSAHLVQQLLNTNSHTQVGIPPTQIWLPATFLFP